MSSIIAPDLPARWHWRPLDSIAEVSVSNVDKKTHDGEQPIRLCNYTDVYYNDQITGDIDFMEATASAEQKNAFAVRAGDVVITKDSESSDDVGRPAFVPRDIPGVVYGYHLAVYRPFDKVYSRFLKYAFDSSWVRLQFELRTPGVTRIGLNRDTLRNLKIPVPVSHEALAVADYLDRETAEIDALVQEFKTLIEVGRERIEADRARYFGGTENAPLTPLKRAADLLGGSGFPVNLQGLRGLELPFFKVGSLASTLDGHLDHSDDSISRKTASELNAAIVPPGSILMAKIGAALYLRRNAINKVSCCIDNNMLAIVPRDGVDLEFLRNSLLLMDLTPIANPGAVPSLNMRWFRDMRIALPAPHIQRKKVEMFSQRQEKSADLLRSAEQAIAFAKERRAALITAAVTGQINVTATHKPVAEQLEDELAEAR